LNRDHTILFDNTKEITIICTSFIIKNRSW